ncbi:hypothetical protein P175DRAFT_0130144 [Aspergillus ochraceoroseus IBT 24754]|uniref:Life-span regulatory factor domain-containing protein n=3 Tax=Aspergillus subgen. Nidulantes TaxID=2720870 RepID=A0A0F8VMR3_9EURO|nr:uncharacterized protein P175DRAFT_0130144 [Aspergillus ochraceoroseus IBT 24754]KKK14072.1 hypothetical protein AOCH_007798 [Aspergillus ochraceoroseus]KKK24396.1 hypothetical protein ARAM_004381 [Aspergillus rambellii]PTU22370.1 hypothetical protein P175DRAFT_0130144 [Aspergillus ochraceoroseus IBT 24754]
MATEWSLDFCLVCDRQTLGGPYCSQSCRLAELDVSHEASSYSHESRAAPKKNPRAPGKVTVTTTFIQSTTTRNSQWNFYRPPQSSKALSPSSSQTSLSSLKSNSSSQASPISSQFQNELRDYASCFDHVRDLKRRLTT